MHVVESGVGKNPTLTLDWQNLYTRTWERKTIDSNMPWIGILISSQGYQRIQGHLLVKG